MNITFTPEKKKEFLEHLSETCNVSRSAEKAGVSRMVCYQHRAADHAFAALWEEAMRIGAEALEDEVRRRAFEGVDEPVFYQGAESGTIKKYSDTLAIFLLKGALPEKYRENSKIELGGHLSLMNMTEEEIKAELATLMASGVVPTPSPSADDSAAE
jgi:hypothetical protein